jgi:hypothetical protein
MGARSPVPRYSRQLIDVMRYFDETLADDRASGALLSARATAISHRIARGQEASHNQ